MTKEPHHHDSREENEEEVGRDEVDSPHGFETGRKCREKRGKDPCSGSKEGRKN